MKTTLHTRNYNVSDKLRVIIDRKVAKLDKYFDAKAECIIVCERVGSTEKMELTIISGGHTFRAQENKGNMYHNIDKVLEKVEHQVHKNRDKLRTAIRKDAVNEKQLSYARRADVRAIVIPEVKKNKSFDILTLPDHEAETRMSTLDHDFFVYADEKHHGVKVMYRRPDGHVGVIDITNAHVKN